MTAMPSTVGGLGVSVKAEGWRVAPSEPPPPFELVTFEGDGLSPPYTWERLSDALVDQDVEGLRS